MFGQQNNQSDPQDAQIPEQSIDGVLSNTTPPVDTGVAGLDPAWQHPGAPLDQTTPSIPDPMPAPMITPATDDKPSVNPFGTPSAPADDPAPAPSSSSDDSSASNDLIDIKQQALNQLSPLVGQLDQSPEDKFRTLMMMIQASDDQAKINEAYQAAQAITDEKARAQALLDVINEINYFTQHSSEA